MQNYWNINMMLKKRYDESCSREREWMKHNNKAEALSKQMQNQTEIINH